MKKSNSSAATATLAATSKPTAKIAAEEKQNCGKSGDDLFLRPFRRPLQNGSLKKALLS